MQLFPIVVLKLFSHKIHAFTFDNWPQWASTEMKLISKSRKLKRLLGLKVHHDGFKPIDSLEWRSTVS